MCPSIALSLALILGIQLPAPAVPQEVVSAVDGDVRIPDSRRSKAYVTVSFKRSFVFSDILSHLWRDGSVFRLRKSNSVVGGKRDWIDLAVFVNHNGLRWLIRLSVCQLGFYETARNTEATSISVPVEGFTSHSHINRAKKQVLFFSTRYYLFATVINQQYTQLQCAL